MGPGVLIPRPDTETLVEVSLSLLEGVPSPAVADLCAGSGAVAVAFAHCRPDAAVWALERSELALPYLRENIARNGVAVAALPADVLVPPPLPPLDLAVSNPPYIRRGDLPGLSPQVRREPEMALDGGEDGLDFYRALPPLWLPRLRPGGALAFEVGYDQAEEVAALLEAAGFVDVRAVRDLAGILRVVHGRRPLF